MLIKEQTHTLYKVNSMLLQLKDVKLGFYPFSASRMPIVFFYFNILKQPFYCHFLGQFFNKVVLSSFLGWQKL